jgi:multicomponent Na+:H+ antiporter subunit F
MNTFLLAIAILIAVLTAICLYRVAVGRTIFDRVISAGLAGTNGVILLVLIGFLYHRIDMFIDIAIVYALLNFMMVIMLSRYFERGGEKPE